MPSVTEFLGLNIITLKYFALLISLNILSPTFCTFMLSMYPKRREVRGWERETTSQHIPKEEGPNSKTANMVSLEKQLALRKTAFKKKSTDRNSIL